MGQDLGSQGGEASLIPPGALTSRPPVEAPVSSSLMRTLSSIRQSLREPFVPAKREGDDTEPSLDTVLALHRASRSRGSTRALRLAYQVAASAHHGQMRKSGQPYIVHPLAVAEILAELGMDTTTLIAALLHDTVEDTSYTLNQLRNDFGDEVAHLVDGVTKLDKVQFAGVAEAETTRKMILAAGRDVRVLLIKLADRLHNMRTLGAKSRASQVRIAKVTRDILIPLAGRLGVQLLKRELEDLVLAALEPAAYAEIAQKVEARRATRAAYTEQIRSALAPLLRRDRVRAHIVDRPRHYMSVHERQREQSWPTELCDDPRVVIVVDGEIADCYAALGVVHNHWRPVPGRFKDFIAVPKYNLYKSLHTTVLGPQARPLDVLIRTRHMHRIAEYGIAERCCESRTGWLGSTPPAGDWADESAELDWLQRLLEWQPDAESESFLESLRYDLSDHEITVFTPRGDPIPLPSDATPVDLAYAVDTVVGDRCIGARVNGRLAPLSSPLADGDVVEVLTSPASYAGPERAWLEFVRSSRARLQIKRWFEEHDPAEDETVEKGRAAIAQSLFSHGRLLVHEQPLIAVARALGLADVNGLYRAVARGDVCADDVVKRAIGMVDGG